VVLGLVAFLYLGSISIALTMIDLDLHRLPDAVVLPAYIVMVVLLGAASLLAGDPWSLLRAGIGGAGLFAIYFLLAVVRPGGMGFGDVKLAGVLGFTLAWLGWGTLAVGAFAPFLLGGLYGVVLVVVRRTGRKTGIPFGPWMLGGAWIGIVAGQPIAAGYLSLFGLA
jgi:leader peptidase (prepilin peptidase)/N-methyltransferase